MFLEATFLKFLHLLENQSIMKKAIFYFFALTFLLTLQNCIWGRTDDGPITFIPEQSDYSPVILNRDIFENSTSLETPRNILNSGKIYVKDNFLFINEPNEGFHVFNNSDPENPVNIAFIKALGSSDLSIKNDVLYINNATDLIAVKPNSDYSSVEITKRIANTFPQMISPDGFEYYNLQDNQIIVNWTLIE